MRFLLAEPTPKPVLRRVRLSDLPGALPASTPSLSAAERSARIARRNRALQRRYGY